MHRKIHERDATKKLQNYEVKIQVLYDYANAIQKEFNQRTLKTIIIASLPHKFSDYASHHLYSKNKIEKPDNKPREK
jgi:hypothetical protein